MHIEELLRTIDRNRNLLHHGGGNDNREYTRCSNCNRPTVAEEHIYTPQRTLFVEEQRDQTYYTCEWCGAEVEPTETTPRKPAHSERGDEYYWERRTA